MSKEFEEVPVYVYVNKLYKENKIVKINENEEPEKVATFRLDPNVTYTSVGTSRKFVHGLPKFSSVSFTVSCSVPAPLDLDQMNQGYQVASDFCEAKLREKKKEVLGE